MSQSSGEISSERRETLAAKGRKLYGKFCGTGGRGICAESFAVYHIGRGECLVAEDLITYLQAVVLELELSDPHNRLAATRGLIERISQHLQESDLPRTGEALREFVLENAAEAESCG
jgi:hypothetical protein